MCGGGRWWLKEPYYPSSINDDLAIGDKGIFSLFLKRWWRKDESYCFKHKIMAKLRRQPEKLLCVVTKWQVQRIISEGPFLDSIHQKLKRDGAFVVTP